MIFAQSKMHYKRLSISDKNVQKISLLVLLLHICPLSKITVTKVMNLSTIIIFFFFISEILNNLCENFLKKNVTTILYLTNSELFGRSTASSQYFLQLASYLGIPVIAWNADNSGLERRVSYSDEQKSAEMHQKTPIYFGTDKKRI